MKHNVLGTSICPATFEQAGRRHGEHFARYLFAARWAKGKRILDAACGGGYGSAYLAGFATSVLGLDLSEEMIALARGAFNLPNVEFRIHDLHQPIEFAGPFDLLVSLETMEHVRDPDGCLSAVATRLTNDAVAIISVPNGTKELQAGNYKPYHEVHFSADEFEKLLRRHFGEVQLFSQRYHRGLGHYLRKLTGRGRHHAVNFRFVPGLLPEAKTWAAVCAQPIR